MQPMWLHWAPRPRGPRAMVVGQVVYFCQILLAQENCRNSAVSAQLCTPPNAYRGPLLAREQPFKQNPQGLQAI